MTQNEQKAKEIAERCYLDYVDEGNMIESSEECYQSALQAMQWKDEQIDIILLTVEGCLRSFFTMRGNTKESIDNFIDAIKAQINRDLSEWKKSSKDIKAMEE